VDREGFHAVKNELRVIDTRIDRDVQQAGPAAVTTDERRIIWFTAEMHRRKCSRHGAAWVPVEEITVVIPNLWRN
jgi:hypothetical protein